MKNKIKTYDLVLEAISAALIAICSWISIPFGDVPFTLQTLAIFAILMIIGGKRGTIAIVVYLLLGAVGVPVFANFTGGLPKLMGPTGGFLVGFVFVGLVYWLLNDVVFKKINSTNGKRVLMNIISAVICEVVLYCFGLVWFVIVYAKSSGPIGFAAAFSMCVLPYLIPDIVKFVVADLISFRVQPIIKK